MSRAIEIPDEVYAQLEQQASRRGVPLPQPDMWSADARQYIFKQWRATARRYGFREYDGPPLEPLELFTLKSGQEIVGNRHRQCRADIRPAGVANRIAPGQRTWAGNEDAK